VDKLKVMMQGLTIVTKHDVLFFATKCANSDTLVYGARAQIDVLELNIPELLKGT
jgi:hypothetical protein